MRKPKPPATTLDLGYLHAATILARQPQDMPITIMLVGCGGTGSYMAMHIGRILHVLRERGTNARAVFIDPDHVEDKNIGRQLFCPAELGLNKAAALALRYGSAWGVTILALEKRFAHKEARAEDDELVVLVGCVDNAAAREELSRALRFNLEAPAAGKRVPAPDVWWLDCGNHEDSGQVLLGSASHVGQLANAFTSKGICQALPGPAMQSPDLLIPTRAEKSPKRMSCAELTAANLQSLNVNAAIAAIAADTLTRFLVTRNLKRFAVEINLAAGSMRSTYATPAAVSLAGGPR